MMTLGALKVLLSSPLALLALMMLASVSNGVKQLAVIRQTGYPMSCAQYYFRYMPETWGMIIGNMICFSVLVLTDQLNFASALGVGYGVNSIVDLLPGHRSFELKNTLDDPVKIERRNGNGNGKK